MPLQEPCVLLSIQANVAPAGPSTPIPCGVLPVSTDAGGSRRVGDAPSKNKPLTTALSPPVGETRILTCPVRFQTRYWPLAKLETRRLSSTSRLVASRT